MKNLQLFKNEEFKKSKFQECKDCFSCNVIEVENVIDYFKQNFEYSEENSESLVKSLSSDEISSLISRFIEILSTNKLQRLQKKLTCILSNLILFKNSTSINFHRELEHLASSKIAAELVYETIKTIKIKENKLKEN